MRQTPDGLFLAEYSSEIDQAALNKQPVSGPGADTAPGMPDSHLGTEEASVRLWVEQMAKGMGYSQVMWEAGTEPEGTGRG